jgi:hypothetical protein
VAGKGEALLADSRWPSRRAFAAFPLAAALAMSAVAIPPALGERAHRAQAPAKGTLELVNVEIDRSGMVSPDQWTITESSATLDAGSFRKEHSWTVPGTIPPAGATATLSVASTSRSAGPVQAKVTLSGHISIDGGPSAELAANADSSSGTATTSSAKTVGLAPRGGSPAHLIVKVQDGPSVRFDYRVVGTPPGFDRPRSRPAPGKGRVRLITSPVIPRRAPALSVQLRFTDAGSGASRATPRATFADVDARKAASDICWLVGEVDGAAARGAITARRGVRRLNACIEILNRVLNQRPPRPCTAVALPVARRDVRRSRRVRLQIGSPGTARPRLRVRCSKAADGTVSITVRPRRRSARLRDLVGRRLRLAVGRPRGGEPAPAGERLTVRWALPGG